MRPILLGTPPGVGNGIRERLLRNEYRWEILSRAGNYGDVFGNPWLEDPSPGSGRLLAGVNLGPIGALAISRATK